MSEKISTNIRVGPGVYNAIKYISDSSGLGMGTITNLLLMIAFAGNGNIEKVLKTFPNEIQQTIMADFCITIGELFKTIGPSMIQDPGLASLYKRLLKPD